jgi:uncharacterized protein YhhL (DUF1145 family)
VLEFIVLGQVPGTQIQLNFQATLLLCVVLVVLLKLVWPFRNKATKVIPKVTTKLETVIVRPFTRRRA